MRLKRIEIEEGDWTDEPRAGALIVFLHLADGQVRWCFFHSPESLRAGGDMIGGTDVRIHGGANHMIVLSTLTRATIDAAIKHLEGTGQLLEFTRAC